MSKKIFNTKTMAVLSVLLALEVIIARFGTIRPSETIKLSLDFIPVVIAAILFGPIPAIVMGILADILGAFLFPMGPFFPGFTVTAAVTGLIYGLLLHKSQSFPRILIAVLLQQLLCSLLLNTFWLHVLYGSPYLPTMATRLIQCAIMVALQLALIPIIAKTIQSVNKEAKPMNASSAISYIESCTWSATRLGLERTQELLHALGDPQKKLRFIHVAGSNGKGSTCAMLASILNQAGYKTGLYTSPYIQTFCERIQINGQNIPEKDLARITERVRIHADRMDDHPSQFELVTAIAMEYYAECACDIVVLEVGMGGALDSTNVIDAPEVAVITNIGLEHTEYLGSTLEAIAETKGGIIKPGCDCVCYPSDDVVLDTLKQLCASRNVQMQIADTDAVRLHTSDISGQCFSFHDWIGLQLPLLGAHQLKNAAVALSAIEALRERNWSIPDEAVFTGMQKTVWPARMEVLHRDPLFLLDGGHNPQCAEALANGIADYLPEKKVTFLLGVLADKDSDSMLQIVRPYGASYVCLTPNNPRALSAESLKEKLLAADQTAVAAPDIESGILTALQSGNPVVAFGSLYLAGEIRTKFPAVMKRFQRREALDRRKALTNEERSRLSARVCQNILSSNVYLDADTILVYNAFGSETDLSAVIRQAKKDGKRICWPCCLSRTEMAAYTPNDDNSWKAGAFGIREPDPALSVLVPPQEIDLILCPCAGFDPYGHRIGMGAGYYDRYLPLCKNAVRVIAAFEVQRINRLYTETTDCTVDMLATEAGLFPAETEDQLK